MTSASEAGRAMAKSRWDGMTETERVEACAHLSVLRSNPSHCAKCGELCKSRAVAVKHCREDKSRFCMKCGTPHPTAGEARGCCE